MSTLRYDRSAADGSTNRVEQAEEGTIMDLDKMIHFAQVVGKAYEILPDQIVNADGQTITVALGGASTTYSVITTIYANDLATDMNPGRGNRRVSIGLVLQDPATGDAVIAIRGTEGILEWVQDARFFLVPCPFLTGAGHTEDGFTSVYSSFTVDPALGSASVTRSLAGLPWKKPPQSLTICGHSLGGALATLLTLDVAANTTFTNPAVYTYASPRTGDPLFVSTYNHVVQRTCRIANRMDLVPKLPLPPLYDHVGGLFDLNPVILSLPPTILVKPEIACEHILSTYLHLLTRQAGGVVLPLDPKCVPL
jgi:lipase (class 3)